MNHTTEKEMNPAFPVSTDNYHYEGMTLRDYFAAKAMEGHVAARHGDYELFKPEGVAAWAYVMADAMLKEREK